MTSSHDENDQTPFRYDARLANEIELAWQHRWQAEGTFYAPNPVGPLAAGFERAASRPKAYVLDFFPYPSGIGLHVGHPLGYIATDVLCRFLRMTGRTVLHAFGYDAFGLPAEQYAISTGQDPKISTKNNIDNMRRQLLRLGLGYDTRREFATTDPRFYRWTQWIFLQIYGSWFDEGQQRARPISELIAEFEAGTRAPSGPANPDGKPWADLDELTRRQVVDGWRLAYIAEEMVNWSPGLGTVLANEEVTAEGRSDVGNYPVYRRPLRQWLLRITAYAERLLADLDQLDWPEPIKQQQRNWIGPSDGAVVAFDAPGPSGLRIEAFTTRPDTLPGATYLVLAPEHPLAEALAAVRWPEGTPQAWRFPAGRDEGADWAPADAVRAYREAASMIGDRQRLTSRDKTGVFTGTFVVNPATGGQIPVFLADYVLMGYGTGAIMGVPADDERDLEFARTLGLPVISDYERIGDTDVSDDERIGNVDVSDDERFGRIRTAIGWLEATGHGHRQRTYRLRDWLFSRQRYWGEPFPIVYDSDGLPVALPEEMLPVTLPEMTDFAGRQAEPSEEPVPPLARARDWAEVELDLGGGRQRYRRELNTMPQWAGSCWYYLRYLDPDNDAAFVDPRNERYWMVPEGGGAGEEIAPGDGGVDLYVGGVEHAVLHLLYARFWHKILFDLGHVSTREPFRRLINQGYITADAFTDARGMYVPAGEVEHLPDGRLLYHGAPVTRRAGKMGKSLKNSVSPDDIYAEYGADTLRLYEMSMGPLDADRPWHTDDIVGVHRFLQRLWRSLVDEATGELIVSEPEGRGAAWGEERRRLRATQERATREGGASGAPRRRAREHGEPEASRAPRGRAGNTDGGAIPADAARLLNQTIGAVREHYAGLRFNIAIARLQELSTHAARIAAARGKLPRAIAEPLVLMVAPLAPHVAEELWARLGHAESIAYAAFPEADPALAAEPTVVLPVQIDGRTRFRIEVPADAGQEQIAAILAGHPDIARYVGDAGVDRLVIVPGRIANVVTRR
jgi:leucyl-tRNA synthetase